MSNWEKKREDGNTYLEKEKRFLDEIKSIFHNHLRAPIW